MKGTIKLQEVSRDTVQDDELQCEVKVEKPKKANSSEEKTIIDAFKKLLPIIRERLVEFDKEFKLKAES